MTTFPRPSARTLGMTVLLGAALLLSAGVADSQRFRSYVEPNAAYDGQYTFVRLRYDGHPGWSFDYPAMERNFMTILQDLSTVRPKVRESNVFDMDDPGLSRYAVAYLSEPGFWYPDEAEVLGLRTWLQKGGFLIVDDFLFEQWQPFEQAITQVLPGARLVRLTVDHPIFQSFFSIESLDGMHHPGTPSATAEYYGIFEDNDPSRRLMVIVNYNNDIGDYMEWSGEGWYPVNLSNDAYKFATNYIVYGLTR
jgi:hypothetical protein